MAKKKPKPKPTRAYNRTMPENPPKAFQSPLWPHLEEIRSLRRARKTWLEIAEHLQQRHGLKITLRAVRNFFVRATNPNRRIPAGLEEHVHAPPRHPAPVPPPSNALPVPPAAAPNPLEEQDPLLRIEEPPKVEGINERKRRLLREQREREQRESH